MFFNPHANSHDWHAEVLKPAACTLAVSWIKSLIASWLDHFSTGLAKTIGCGALNCGDVWWMFQALAKDQGEAQDFDLPSKLDSFRQELSRRRKEFPLEALDTTAQQAV